MGVPALKLAGAGVGGAPATRADGDGQALDDAALALLLAGVHAVVDGEVAADHVGARGGRVAGQLVRLAGRLARVLAVVDADGAGVAVAGLIALVGRFRPVSSLAEA